MVETYPLNSTVNNLQANFFFRILRILGNRPAIITSKELTATTSTSQISSSGYYFLTATLTVRPRKPQTGGGRRGPNDHRDFGGGGGGGGRGGDAPNYGERLRRYRLGVALALVAIVLLFVSFTTAFILRQGMGTYDATTGTYVRDWQPVNLPIKLLIVNTCILLLSSITLELARRQAAEHAVLAPVIAIPGISAGPRHPVPWLAISISLGIAFLVGQGLAWRELLHRGSDMGLAPGSATFYILTAAHALHLLGGLLALLYAGAATFLLRKGLETQRMVIDVTAWYWHVMAALWVYIFAVMAISLTP